MVLTRFSRPLIMKRNVFSRTQLGSGPWRAVSPGGRRGIHMVTTPRGSPCAAWTGLLAAGLLGVFVAADPLAAQQPKVAKRDGLYIPVLNPITDAGVKKIKDRVEEAIKKQSRDIRLIVFDFNPPKGQPSGTSEFDPCNALARYIKSLRAGLYGESIKSVAFLRSEVTKHTVLPVLACSEIVMANDPEQKKVASLGDVGAEADQDPTMRTAYAEVADFVRDRGSHRALVMRMIKPNLAVHK